MTRRAAPLRLPPRGMDRPYETTPEIFGEQLTKDTWRHILLCYDAMTLRRL